MAANAPGFIASSPIYPSTIVKLDTAANFHVKPMAALTDTGVIGIAQDGTYAAPGVPEAFGVADPLPAAYKGNSVTVYGEGEQCLLLVGATGVTAGDCLTLDTTVVVNNSTLAGGSASYIIGAAKTIAFTAGTGKVTQIAVALETANAGELVRVVVAYRVIGDITA